MASTTFFGQKNNPFIFDMNLKELDKEIIDIIDKEKEKEYISNLSSRYQNVIIFLQN